MSRLSEICEIRPPKSEVRQRLSGQDRVAFLPMEYLGIGQKYVEAKLDRPLADVQGSYTYFANGDLLLAKITPCFENGKMGIARRLRNGAGFGSSEYVVLRPKHQLVPEYLYYCLLQPSFREAGISSMSGAVGQQRIAMEFVEKYPIPVPIVSEQRRIVAILDEAFGAITAAMANTEKNLADIPKVFQAQVDLSFSEHHRGWSPTSLNDVATQVSTGPFGSLVHKADYVSGGTPLVNPINIRDGHIAVDPNKTLSAAAVRRLKTYLLRQGDIVVGRRGEIGRCAVIEQAQQGWICGTGSFFVRPNDRVHPHFLAALLRSSRYSGELERVSAGTTMKNLSNAALRDLCISLPQVGEQERLMREWAVLKKNTDELKQLNDRKMALLIDLKRSVLARAFRGQLSIGSARQMTAVAAE